MNKGNRSGNNQFEKITIEDVREVVNKSGLILISDKYINNRQKLIFKDKKGYYYVSILDRLKQNMIPERFHKCNPYTIQNIKLWCKLNNKPFELLSNEYDGNNRNLKWRCLKDSCSEPFDSTWSNIYKGEGCGVCHGKQVSLSNCLAIRKPESILIWHPTKNGDLTPWNVTHQSNIRAWWRCDKNHKHEWCTSISSIHGCPYCLGMLPSEEYNLLICNPELCKEWDYNKNKKKPEEYCPNSGKYVWWKCKKCGNEWRSRIASRKHRGCPECNKSKSEVRCEKFYNLNDIYYIPQKTFDGLVGVGNGLLSYDSYLPAYNSLVECQGEFHDGTAKMQSEKDFKIQQEHDRRKREYAKNNNIKLLEIWYWDFDRIEEILEKELLHSKEFVVS